MARKSLQELSGIAKTIAQSGPSGKERPTRSTAPAVGALQGSLSAIRDIDPGLIDDWGPKDRLDEFTAVNSVEDGGDGYDALRDSINAGGQQVPILVRRSSQEGRFEVIYGRRRLRACAELGIKVRANIQDLDDATALIAKGLENAARRNLSFYEKARFAEVIQLAGHDKATTRQVLNLTKSGLSHLTRVTDHVPSTIGDLIGPAPKSGRPKWTALADGFARKKTTEKAAAEALTKVGGEVSSDDRLDFLLKEISRRGTRSTQPTETVPVEGVTIRTGASTIAVSINRRGKNAAFSSWLNANLEEIIKRSYREFTAVNPEDEPNR